MDEEEKRVKHEKRLTWWRDYYDKNKENIKAMNSFRYRKRKSEIAALKVEVLRLREENIKLKNQGKIIND